MAAQVMFVVQSVINFFIHSGTAQAALTMPIMAPLADLVGLTRQTMVYAFQLCEFINPILPDLGRHDGRARDGEDPVGEVGALVPAADAGRWSSLSLPAAGSAGADALGPVLMRRKGGRT